MKLIILDSIFSYKELFSFEDLLPLDGKIPADVIGNKLFKDRPAAGDKRNSILYSAAALPNNQSISLEAAPERRCVTATKRCKHAVDGL